MKTPYTDISFTLPYSLPLEGEYEFELTRTCRVTITNVSVFDERSKAVTGVEVVGGGTITIKGHHGLSHVAKVAVAFSGELHPGSEIEGMIALRENACTALNYLLNVYRVATNDYRIKHVMPVYVVSNFRTFRPFC